MEAGSQKSGEEKAWALGGPTKTEGAKQMSRVGGKEIREGRELKAPI